MSLDQLVEIAEGHLEREEQLLYKTDRFLFTDTNAIITSLFSRYYHRKTAKRLDEITERAAYRYDLVFVCDTDIPHDDTWDRSGDANRQIFHKQLVGDLLARRIPFFLLRGGLETRLDFVKKVLPKFCT